MKRILFLLTAMSIGMVTSGAVAGSLPGPVVETDWLKSNLENVVILDIRSDLKSFAAKPVFKKNKKTGKNVLVRVGGHIKNARLVNYRKIRGKRKIDGREVTRMIIPRTDFEALIQKAGINKGDVVVVVSKGLSTGDMTAATRIFWQMKYYGHDDIAILNGGLAQWLVDGNEVSTGLEAYAKGNWVATTERKNLLATSAQIQDAAASGKYEIIDNRPIDQYLGVWHKSYVYKPGHIPGARIFPVELMMRSTPPVKFLPPDELRKLMIAMRIDPKAPAVNYCNSGHLASGGWFVMHEILGNKNVSLYDGSMHQWTLEKRPTEVMILH